MSWTISALPGAVRRCGALPARPFRPEHPRSCAPVLRQTCVGEPHHWRPGETGNFRGIAALRPVSLARDTTAATSERAGGWRRLLGSQGIVVVAGDGLPLVTIFALSVSATEEAALQCLKSLQRRAEAARRPTGRDPHWPQRGAKLPRALCWSSEGLDRGLGWA